MAKKKENFSAYSYKDSADYGSSGIPIPSNSGGQYTEKHPHYYAVDGIQPTGAMYRFSKGANKGSVVFNNFVDRSDSDNPVSMPFLVVATNIGGFAGKANRRVDFTSGFLDVVTQGKVTFKNDGETSLVYQEGVQINIESDNKIVSDLRGMIGKPKTPHFYVGNWKDKGEPTENAEKVTSQFDGVTLYNMGLITKSQLTEVYHFEKATLDKAGVPEQLPRNEYYIDRMRTVLEKYQDTPESSRFLEMVTKLDEFHQTNPTQEQIAALDIRQFAAPVGKEVDRQQLIAAASTVEASDAMVAKAEPTTKPIPAPPFPEGTDVEALRSNGPFEPIAEAQNIAATAARPNSTTSSPQIPPITPESPIKPISPQIAPMAANLASTSLVAPSAASLPMPALTPTNSSAVADTTSLNLGPSFNPMVKPETAVASTEAASKAPNPESIELAKRMGEINGHLITANNSRSKYATRSGQIEEALAAVGIEGAQDNNTGLNVKALKAFQEFSKQHLDKETSVDGVSFKQTPQQLQAVLLSGHTIQDIKDDPALAADVGRIAANLQKGGTALAIASIKDGTTVSPTTSAQQSKEHAPLEI